MDAFVKQIPISETIFGNIKKPPDIICVVVFLGCVYSTCIQIVLISESLLFRILNINETLSYFTLITLHLSKAKSGTCERIPATNS